MDKWLLTIGILGLTFLCSMTVGFIVEGDKILGSGALVTLSLWIVVLAREATLAMVEKMRKDQ